MQAIQKLYYIVYRELCTLQDPGETNQIESFRNDVTSVNFGTQQEYPKVANIQGSTEIKVGLVGLYSPTTYQEGSQSPTTSSRMKIVHSDHIHGGLHGRRKMS